MTYSDYLSISKGLSTELLSKWMSNVTVFEVKGVKGVKFAQTLEQATITDSDRALFHIGHSVATLEEREKKYASEAHSLRTEVVAMLKSGNRPMAALLLRRAKMYENQLEKSMKSRDQLLRIAASIEEAHTNAQVFEAMKLGAAALKSENDKIGSVEQVDELMDNVSDLMEEQETLATAIGGAQLSTGDIDESALEKELASLLQEGDTVTKQQHVSSVPISSTSPQHQLTEQDRLVKELEALSVPLKPITAQQQIVLDSLTELSSSAPVSKEEDSKGRLEAV